MTKKFIFPSNQALPILWSSLNDSAEFKNLVIRYLKQEKITDFFALASSINLNLNAFLPHRFGLTAKTPEELIQKLEDNHYKTTTSPQKPTLFFLFPGQGESYADLTKSLYEKLPAFKKAIDRCASEFKKYTIDLMPSLYSLISNKSNKQNLARYVASFAVGYALSEVWRSFGIMPDKVLGHSDGEYTAAVVSGILSLEDAIFLISQRLKLIETKTVSGSMLAVLCNLATVKKIIAEFNIENTASTVTLAVINSFEDMVIAGLEKDILAIKQKFELYNIKTRDLEIISHAFHSKLMQPILAEFEEVANKVSYNAPNIPFISALEAKPVTDITGEYWEKHIIDPVNFQSAVSTLLQENQVQSLCFLELGINAMLSHLVKKNVPSALCFTSLDAKHEAWEGIAATLVELYMAGFSIDFHRFYGVHNHFPAFIEKLLNQQLALVSFQGNTLSHSTEPEEPIAIIGFSCRFPGNLDNPEEFWEALLQSKDCMLPAPARSWDSALYDSLEMKPPKIGGWINKPDYFDPAFFNCSTIEAITMDPQQRMLMLTTWEALEHAGISLTELREKNKQGQRIGICAGISLSDYGNLLARQHINNAWVPSGNAYSAAADRLAMFLGVEGPTFAIDPVKTGKYRGRVVLIKATDGSEPFTRLIEDPTNGWQEIFENPLEIYSVAGNHYSFIRQSAQKVGHIFTAVFNKEKEYLNNQINTTLTKQEQQFFHALQENDIFMVKSFIDFYINHSISINMDKNDSTGKNVFDYAKLYHNEDLENLLKKYFSIILPNYQKTKLSRFFKLSTNSDINVIPEDKRLAPSPSREETSNVESTTQDASIRGTKQDRP